MNKEKNQRENRQFQQWGNWEEMIDSLYERIALHGWGILKLRVSLWDKRHDFSLAD